jgi:type III secretion protein R
MVEPLSLILALAAAALVPFIAIAASSFIKIAVVLMLIRNAIGTQQTPPNIALNALAMIISIFVMAPVIREAYAAASAVTGKGVGMGDIEAVYNAVLPPVLAFLQKNAGQRELQYFYETATYLWPPAMRETIGINNILIVLPAFTLTELREAFEIGFLIYLPFIAIDLIVSNILLAMGMMMVSPLTISLPFKLLLFVMVDGWSKLTLAVVKTYI